MLLCHFFFFYWPSQSLSLEVLVAEFDFFSPKIIFIVSSSLCRWDYLFENLKYKTMETCEVIFSLLVPFLKRTASNSPWVLTLPHCLGQGCATWVCPLPRGWVCMCVHMCISEWAWGKAHLILKQLYKVGYNYYPLLHMKKQKFGVGEKRRQWHIPTMQRNQDSESCLSDVTKSCF